MALTPKQQRFVEEYLVDLNATAAYRRAGYAAKSDNSVASSASALLRNPKVREAVEAGQAAIAARSELTADWVVERLREEATRVGQGASHSARVSALTKLGEHVGMWREKPPLEALLDALPPSLRERLVAELAAAVQPRGTEGAGVPGG